KKKKKQRWKHHRTRLHNTAQRSTALIEHVARKRIVSRLAALSVPSPVSQLHPISTPKPLFPARATPEEHKQQLQQEEEGGAR
uniref:DUF1713 domain-containing protein n=1 Tax=Mesocestoides corti TaxID=53468 RepID=A0A5K3G5V4_MESCO